MIDGIDFAYGDAYRVFALFVLYIFRNFFRKFFITMR